MLRSTWSVVAGYLIFAVPVVLLFWISGHRPQAHVPLVFAVGSTLFGIAFALLAGYLAAWLAPRRRFLHAVFVACLIAIGALASLAASPQGTSTWSQWSTLCVIAPAAIAGGLLRTRRRR